ncbi:MAG: SDR family NAD(P)-dependent oxidoreductase [Candidatus Binatia bacterium]|jgi:pteridine reductase
MQNLQGTVAVVTAGARRLGRAIALALAQAGCNVAITFRSSPADADATLENLRATGVNSLAVQADVADAEQVDRVLDRTLAAFGRVDILVANAGAFRRTPVSALTEADWDDMITNNLRTAFLCSHRFGLHMRAHGGGAIVTLADVAGLRPWADHLPYCIAKACVIALTRALAQELAPSVRVNAVAPGPVLFPEGFDAAAKACEVSRTLLQRQGASSNVADAVLCLLRNDYITGAVLPVDGGRVFA